MDDPLSQFRRAIEILGGQSATARKLGVKQPHIWNWLNKSKRLPAEYVLPMEAATREAGEVVPRQALRPDLYPAESSGEAA